MSEELTALWLTLQLAATTTIFLIFIGTPIAWWLARTQSPARTFIEPIVALPIVLPPTVMGFYLLLAFAPQSAIGQAWASMTGSPLAFSFEALVIGSIIYSAPFYIQPLQVAFESLPARVMDAAATLGASPLDRFFTIAVPLSRQGFVIACCLAFAHTIGEFGIVLMIGGSIPGETRVLSIALFEHVETLDYARAHWLAGGLLAFSFALLFIVYRLNRQWRFSGGERRD